MFVSDVGKAVDGAALQYNIVRVDGQKSVYVAVQKQGGDTQHDRRGERNPQRDQKSARYSRAVENVTWCSISPSS